MRWFVVLAVLLAVAVWHVAGLVLAVFGLGGAYLVSCRLNPRVRHRSGFRHCGGTGEIKGWIFTSAFRRCPKCAGGRLIRRGSRHVGPDYIRTEHAAGKAQRRDRQRRGTWR